MVSRASPVCNRLARGSLAADRLRGLAWPRSHAGSSRRAAGWCWAPPPGVHQRAAELGDAAVGVIADLTVDGAADSLVRAALDRWGRRIHHLLVVSATPRRCVD
jgi:hypothetical protein